MTLATTRMQQNQKLGKIMRKTIFIALVASSLVVLSGANGRAGTLWDIDVFFKYLSDKTTSYTGSFDIKSQYDPALETVTDAQAWFFVKDDELWNPKDKSEKVAIDLGDESFLGSNSAYFNLLGGDISGDALATLDTFGTLKYTIGRTEGDFLAMSAKLYVETSPRAVPDGGATLMLLGVALAGIESLRRKMARRTQRMV
jgi:hypothetical protein